MNTVSERLFAFDMDGTLLPKTTGLLELAEALGTQDELRELEARFSEGKLDTVSFTREVSALWGPISSQTAQIAFEKAPKLEGITEMLCEIREVGGVSCIITMSQDIFANHFKDFGFDHVISTPYPPHNDNNFSKVLKPSDKPVVLRKLASKYAFDFAETVAFGDSLSDVELFSHLRHSIAVNADQYLIKHAAFSYTGRSILEAFQNSKILWSPV